MSQVYTTASCGVNFSFDFRKIRGKLYHSPALGQLDIPRDANQNRGYLFFAAQFVSR